MQKEISLTLTPFEAYKSESIRSKIFQELNVEKSSDLGYRILKKSIDARNRGIKVNLKLQVFINEPISQFVVPELVLKDVSKSAPVHIAGAGPAGLFAAIRLIEGGLKPVILERGKDVSKRRFDIANLNKNQNLNVDSNYCFGEGGAGTFSDGKLYTRSNKRGSIQKVLEILFLHGAPEEILYDAHPHIGTDKLPNVIENIRKTILEHGGEIHFENKLVDFKIQNKKLVGVSVKSNESQNDFDCENLILATGHSARDIYEMFQTKNLPLEFKTFALGVRVEHPQELIDQMQYHQKDGRGDYLPAAAYQLISQVDGRGVYSFCMCPGGIIVPAMTNYNEIVVNGMSNSMRNSRFANSGIVVEIRREDIPNFHRFGEFAGLQFQKCIEELCYQKLSNKTLQAPAQRLVDFLNSKVSGSLPQSSYIPGLKSAPLHQALPSFLVSKLQKGFLSFGQKLRHYLTNEAIIVATESRTSTPLRIVRDEISLEHPFASGIYPCGEGAGYAGGIVSSAMDGIRCAEAILKK